MPVPDYQTLMLPLLAALADGREWKTRDLTVYVADAVGLSNAERAETIPSGDQTVIGNRVMWAKTYLKNAGLVESPVRGQSRITAEGKRVLAAKPVAIDNQFLRRYPSFCAFFLRAPVTAVPTAVAEPARTPQEVIAAAVAALRAATAADLLDRLKKCSPGFFEHVVVRLLQALGYGATGEALVTGKSGDGGVDGIIKEDKLGLDVVCVQAKRWESPVGRPAVQAFVGSMDYYRAKKGVVITTSSFTRDAVDYVDRIEGKKVVLLDGPTLAGLMIDYDVGVTVTTRYALKDVSSDFFAADDY